MEINFRKPSYLADHFNSALREDCILCLNRITSKDLLAFFIVNEFVRLKDAACFVVSTTSDWKSFENIQSWIETFTELSFKPVHDLETLSPNNLKSVGDVIGTSLDSLLAEITHPKPVMKNSSLLMIDLTNDTSDEALLKKIRPIYEFCINANIRFVILEYIHKILLTDPQCITKFFDMYHKEMQITANISCDSIVFGNNGNVVKVCINAVEDKSYDDGSLFCIQKMIQECKELLSVVDKEIFTADENELLMEFVKQLELFYQRFGLLAISMAVDHFVELLKKWKKNNESESFQLIAECLQTKLFVIKVELQSYLEGQQEYSSLHEMCISQSLEKLLHTLKLFVARTEESELQLSTHDEIRICIAFESEFSAEIMLDVLKLLKSAPSYAFLDRYRIFLLDWDWEDIFNENEHFVFVTSVKQAVHHLYKLTLDSAVLFGAPKDYQEFLELKKLLRRRNGFLELIVPIDYQEAKMSIKNFQEVEEVLLKRTPSYLDPDEALMLLAESKHNLEAFQPDGHVCRITPEESVKIVNKYTEFLTYRRSNMALNHKTSFRRDETGDLDVKTAIYFPAKSMVKDSIEVPILRFKNEEEQSIVYCTAVSRMASCLEACKMLYDAHELNENLEPTRKVVKRQAEPNEGDPVLLSQKKWYWKHIPKLLNGSFPKPSTETFIYVVKTQNMTSCNAEIGDKHLGFCTTKKLPKMPSFLIYNRADTLIIQISELERTVVIKEDKLCLLKDFHLFVLNHVLKYNVHDSSDAPGNKHDHGILWTVLVKDGSKFSIDYDFLESWKVVGTQCSNQEPLLQKVDESGSLKDAVILLRHKPDDKKFYFVNDEDLKKSVDDPFPNPKVASTYVDYYHKRFGVDLQHEQVLINLIPVHHNLNLLIQRYALSSKSKSRQQLLVPEELCLLHPVRAHLWKQLVTIPVILYRLSCILFVHELQTELCKELCLLVPDQEPQLDECIYHVLHEAHIRKKFSGFSVVENAVDNVNTRAPKTYESQYQRESECDVVASEVHVDRKKACTEITESRCSFAQAEGRLEKGPSNSRSYSNTTEKGTELNMRDFQGRLWNESGTISRVAENLKLKTNEKLRHRIEAPPLSLILAAMTSPEASDMFNYERLEFLGDAFINTHIAIQLFLSNADATEHNLTLRRSALVSNMSLYKMGEQRHIWRYELEEIFDFKTNPLIKAIIGHELEGEVTTQVLARGESDHSPSSTNDNSNVLKNERCGTPSFENAIPTEFYMSSSGTVCNRNVLDEEPCRTSPSVDDYDVVKAGECDMSSSDMKRLRNVLDEEPCETPSSKGIEKGEVSKDIYDETPSVTRSSMSVPDSESCVPPLQESIIEDTMLKEHNCETYGVRNKDRTVHDNEPCKAPSSEGIVKRHICVDIDDKTLSIHRGTRSEAVVQTTECHNNSFIDQLSEKFFKEKSQSHTKTNVDTNQDVSAASFEVAIRRKPVADSVEALIGLFYLWCGENVALDVMTWLGFDVKCIPRKSGAKQSDQSPIQFKEGNVSQFQLDIDRSCCNVKSFINEHTEASNFPKSKFDLEKEAANENVSDFHTCSDEICRCSLKKQTQGFFGSNTHLAEVVDIESRPTNDSSCTPRDMNTGEQNDGTESSDLSPQDAEYMLYRPKVPSVIKHRSSWNTREGITPYTAKQLSKFEHKIQYHFKDKCILMEALIHASYPRELAPEIYCNQRLEFLGDSLLYLLVADFLCRNYPHAPNSDLTEMRSVVVSSRTFATVALLNDFHKYVIALSPEMCITVKGWKGKIEKDKQDGHLWRLISWNDLPAYHREESKNQGATVEVPKDLADVFESVAGAIYVDSGRLDCVWHCYYRLLKDVLDSLPRPREKMPPK